MKNKIKLIASVLLVLGSTTYSFSQASFTLTSATASASIVTPISLVQLSNMNFGSIAVSGSNAGTVVLNPQTGTRSATLGVTLPVASVGVFSVASFTVNGFGTSAFTITLPNTDLSLSDGSSHTMIANAFTSYPSGSAALISSTLNLKVGATLNVGAGQIAGTYTSVAFPVTVCYN